MSISLNEREIINEIALKIRALYNINGVIDNIDEIVTKMSGKIVEDSTRNIFSDGFIKKDGDDSFIIEVSSNQSVERRNFTIAHELGHLFLHMGFKTNQNLWESQNNITYNKSGNSTREYQANEFAAAFLMPRKIFKEVFTRNLNGEYVDISAVAKEFNVSVDAAAIRGKWLGYIEW